MPPDEIGSALQDLGDQDAVTRGRAVDRIAEEGDRRLSASLWPLLKDPDAVVRFKTACALAAQGDRRGEPVLLWALGNRDLAALSLEALIDLCAPGAIPSLQAFARRRFLHPLERLLAFAALHRAGDPAAAPRIEACLASSRPEERGFALELCGRLALPGALVRLTAVLADPDDPHQLDALRGLRALGDPQALPALERALSSPDDEVAALAREIARELKESRP